MLLIRYLYRRLNDRRGLFEINMLHLDTAILIKVHHRIGRSVIFLSRQGNTAGIDEQDAIHLFAYRYMDMAEYGNITAIISGHLCQVLKAHIDHI